MMELGTTGAFGFDDFHPPEILGLYAGAGCRVVQVYRNRSLAIEPRDILPVCRDAGLRIDSIHGHFGEDLDPSSEDETVRTYTVGIYEFEADFCRRLGGDLVVVHPSPSHVPTGNIERRYSQLQRTFEELAQAGERLGVRYAFENMPPYHPVGADVARLVREVAAAGSEHIVFLMDTGHAHMNGDLAAAIRTAGPHLKYTHVHDNDGANDTHKLPGQGTINWEACGAAMRDIRYEGIFLLEVFESAADLRQLLNDGWKKRISAVRGAEK